ncbi:MAG: hypothetical protein QNI96_15265, partial [Woeseiaceae bacterium]|nr:hypothetical protein [Woeseiaceae bacterium]
MSGRIWIIPALLMGAALSGCQQEPEEQAEESAAPAEIKEAAVAGAPEGWRPYPATPNAQPPAGWTGKEFALSVDFPSEMPQERPPFLDIDFKTDPEAYWQSVRGYIYAGNIDRGVDSNGNSLDWNTQTNPVRTWYNMPWRAVGFNAREFINGLTREFPARAGSLDPGQTKTAYTWARAIYSPLAGYAIGQVWDDETGPPDLAAADFPEGAIIAKLLFTTATVDQVPWVRDAYTWQAFAYVDPDTSECVQNEGPDCPRQVTDVHLYQIDFAVKDSRASETHWVFGTFVHDNTLPGEGFSWDKMVPLGWMWGNDPELTANTPDGVPKESIIFDNTHIYEHLGCHGRLVGPLDNPKSACMSCHMNAQWPNQGANPVPAGTQAQ